MSDSEKPPQRAQKATCSLEDFYSLPKADQDEIRREHEAAYAAYLNDNRPETNDRANILANRYSSDD